MVNQLLARVQCQAYLCKNCCHWLITYANSWFTSLRDVCKYFLGLDGAVRLHTLAHLYGYTLFIKHIHCGEGGLLVTDDDHLAERQQLIRKHGEAVIQSDHSAPLANVLSNNFRLSEIEAAIARAQLHEQPALVASRQRAAVRLRAGLDVLPGLQLPAMADQVTHVYYVFGITLDPERLASCCVSPR